MKKKIISLAIISFLFGSIGITACSSSNDGDDMGGNSGTTNSGDTDSGNNNNSEPDNIPGSSGSGTGSGSGSQQSWNLVFEDNFENGDTPNEEYWSLAPQGTDTWNRHMSESYDQAYQKNGYLYLVGELVDGVYKTGGIESRKKFDFQYGQVKCRAKFLRQPQGNHTGIWMMPEEEYHGAWPRSGEIDIMEHLNDDDIIYSTVHYYNETAQEDASSDKTYKIDNDDFNVYGVIWSNRSITFTVNGNTVFTYYNNYYTDQMVSESEEQGDADFTFQYPFVDDFYLILSQSLGGKGTWEGEIDDSELPAIFQIDWIKVWQLED